MVEVGRKYNERTLRRIRQYYIVFNDEKWSPLATKLSWSHYVELLSFKNERKILYYINQCIELKLSRNELRQRIRNNEYERLPEETRNKLISNVDNGKVIDYIKNPIVIRNPNNLDVEKEKALQRLILEDIENFMKELGNSFSFIGSEYKIKIGNAYNYIDLLLYNIKFKCYVVIELKVVELNSNHIGQIQKYMNYIDKNIRTVDEDKTIGIIICKKDNRFIMEYCSDVRILVREYVI